MVITGGSRRVGWHPSHPYGSDRQLPSTGELLRLLRIELWAGAIRPDSFYDFVTHSPPDMNAEKLNPSLTSMLFDAA